MRMDPSRKNITSITFWVDEREYGKYIYMLCDIQFFPLEHVIKKLSFDCKTSRKMLEKGVAIMINTGSTVLYCSLLGSTPHTVLHCTVLYSTVLCVLYCNCTAL